VRDDITSRVFQPNLLLDVLTKVLGTGHDIQLNVFQASPDYRSDFQIILELRLKNKDTLMHVVLEKSFEFERYSSRNNAMWYVGGVPEPVLKKMAHWLRSFYDIIAMPLTQIPLIIHADEYADYLDIIKWRLCNPFDFA